MTQSEEVTNTQRMDSGRADGSPESSASDEQHSNGSVVHTEDSAAPSKINQMGPGSSATNTSSRPSRRPVIIGTILLVALVCAAYGYRVWVYNKTHQSTDDAYLSADIVQVTPQVAGNVARVLVDENQHVKAGQLLVVLDASSYLAAVRQAKANLDVANATDQGAASSVLLTSRNGSAQIQQASGGVSAAMSSIRAMKADTDHSRAALAAADSEVALGEANVRAATAAVVSAKSGVQQAVQGVNSAVAQLETAQAGGRAAESDVTAAASNSERAAKDLARYQQLFAEDAVSQQMVDATSAAATAARAELQTKTEQVAAAKSLVSQRESEVLSARDKVSAADSAVLQASDQLAAARDTVNTARAAVREARAAMASSQADVSQSEGKLSSAVGELNMARTAPQQVDVSIANRKTASAKILLAQAALQSAELDLARTRLVAAVDGVISKKNAEIGQQVAVGQPLMAIVPDNDISVSANFKETQVANMRPGDAAEIEVDELPGRVFKGHIDSMSSGTGATFALLPPDNATGNFTKVVQRLPVKIVLEPHQPDLDQLRAGLSVVATVDTSHAVLGAGLNGPSGPPKPNTIRASAP